MGNGIGTPGIREPSGDVRLLRRQEAPGTATALASRDPSFWLSGTPPAVGYFRMKLNISFPATGCQKLIEVDDKHKLRAFYEKRMAIEVAADALGEDGRVMWFQSVVAMTDKCVLIHGQAHLLLKGNSCYRLRRTGDSAILFGLHCGCQSQYSKLEDVHQYVVRKSLNKEGTTPRTTVTKIQCPFIPRVLQQVGKLL
ncbi:hypothetical protein QTO34_008384 [Cnephaeus nilssonii]|uniref:Small ribosomal subunit protein eS6 n=1 Tax=Cnephaeus nilssonii TaxID=3371016 RepID=A0AA40IA73_CNENI|nr:hypothetical protein QTO34_008384 [Eptesicus nilssonii]